MQIVVTSETDVDAYQWVTKLSANVKEESWEIPQKSFWILGII